MWHDLNEGLFCQSTCQKGLFCQQKKTCHLSSSENHRQPPPHKTSHHELLCPHHETWAGFSPLGLSVASSRPDEHVAALIELGADTANVPVDHVGTCSRNLLLESNKNATTFQRVMIGTPVPIMKDLLRDGIATTASTTFADLTRLQHKHGRTRVCTPRPRPMKTNHAPPQHTARHHRPSHAHLNLFI